MRLRDDLEGETRVPIDDGSASARTLGDPALKVHVHLGHGFDAARYKERFNRGEAIEYSPYDFHLAERPGVTVTFSRDAPTRSRLALASHRRLRFAVDHAWHNRRAIADSDVVWTMAEGDTFALAALMALRLIPRRPIIGAAIWLFNDWFELPAIRRAVYRRLSRQISILTVHSLGSLEVAGRAKLPTRVELSPFGINDTTYAPLPSRAVDGATPIRVLAAGNDVTRDWSTLLAAFGNDDRFVVSAWTSVLGPADRNRVRNLQLPKPAGITEIRAMYAAADAVVVPMIANVFSGITVALEAVALGRPVICSATGGVPTYFAADQVRYVAPGDAAALREAALAARDPGTAEMAARAHARFVADDYTTRGMIDRYLHLTRRVLGIDRDREPA